MLLRSISHYWRSKSLNISWYLAVVCISIKSEPTATGSIKQAPCSDQTSCIPALSRVIQVPTSKACRSFQQVPPAINRLSDIKKAQALSRLHDPFVTDMVARVANNCTQGFDSRMSVARKLETRTRTIHNHHFKAFKSTTRLKMVQNPTSAEIGREYT